MSNISRLVRILILVALMVTLLANLVPAKAQENVVKMYVRNMTIDKPLPGCVHFNLGYYGKGCSYLELPKQGWQTVYLELVFENPTLTQQEIPSPAGRGQLCATVIDTGSYVREVKLVPSNLGSELYSNAIPLPGMSRFHIVATTQVPSNQKPKTIFVHSCEYGAVKGYSWSADLNQTNPNLLIPFDKPPSSPLSESNPLVVVMPDNFKLTLTKAYFEENKYSDKDRVTLTLHALGKIENIGGYDLSRVEEIYIWGVDDNGNYLYANSSLSVGQGLNPSIPPGVTKDVEIFFSTFDLTRRDFKWLWITLPLPQFIRSGKVSGGAVVSPRFFTVESNPTVATVSPKNCSVESVTASSFTLVNRMDIAVTLYWVGYDCKEVFYSVVSPGTVVEQPTFLTHVWRVRDASGNLVKEFTSKDAGNSTITIE